MDLTTLRYTSDADSSGGLLYDDQEFLCFTCEDQRQDVKVAGETRIPEGSYEIKLRDEGGMTNRYAARYPSHRGMLHLQDVPGFKYVYIHVGNNDDHTEGCILVGFTALRQAGENVIAGSVDAYTELYRRIVAAMDRGETVTINIKEMGL